MAAFGVLTPIVIRQKGSGTPWVLYEDLSNFSDLLNNRFRCKSQLSSRQIFYSVLVLPNEISH